MIFVLLILSLELTIPEDKKESEEESRKTLFAQDPMEIFEAGKLEIANSHTAMSKEDLVDLYLEEGAKYFEIDENNLPPTGLNEGANNTNDPNGVNPNPNQLTGQENTVNADQATGQANNNDTGTNVAGVDPVSPNSEPTPPPTNNEEEEEDPLRKAFKWLGENQNASGSWDQNHQHGITGLVVMAYLTYKERTGSTEFDDALINGVEFLIHDDKCKPGAEKFAYQNGIKTLALTEAARVMGSNPALEKAIKDSVTYIVVGQQDKGGFHYNYNTKTKTQDLSVAAWNLQAMYAAGKLYDIDVAIEGAMKSKPWLTAMSKKFFTYNTKNHEASDTPKESHRESMRAIGAWLTFVLNKENIANIQDDLQGIATETYDGLSWKPKIKHPLYCWSYATMAMLVAGGEDGKKWKKRMNNLLLTNQNSSGYWNPLKYRHGSKPFYTTAFCAQILALVYDYKNAKTNTPKGMTLADKGAEPDAPTDTNTNTETKAPPVLANADIDNKTTNATDPINPLAPKEEGNPDDPINPLAPKEEGNPDDQNAETAATETDGTSETGAEGTEVAEGDIPTEEFDNLISLDKNKAQEIKKRLNVFRRSIKSDPEVRKALEEKDLEALNEAIVKYLNKKFFLEAQLNKMSKDPYIHDEELLKDRYIQLNKQVTDLMKKINLYESDNSDGLKLTPINIFISDKDLDIKLNDGQNVRFSTSADGIKDFQAWLQSKDPQKDVLMINIKPSGVGVFRKIDDHIELLNFKNLTTPVDENMGVK